MPMPEYGQEMKMAYQQPTQIPHGIATCEKEAVIDRQISRVNNVLHDLEMQIDLIHGDLVICTPVDGRDLPDKGNPPRPIGTIEQELGSIVERINGSMERLHGLHCALETMIGRIKLLG
jgi:hypothetical protein